ncbi:cytochrome P450 family protein [Ceratobasidium sp. AG-Ba]|nr:cytochrome P450 family protein [Ceratobasidium sp. AG-Ba]
MTYQGSTLTSIAVLAALYVLYTLKQRQRRSSPLPPSPKGSYPLVGHAFVLPTGDEHLTYAKWSKELNSDIISLEAFGRSIVVLNSVQAATELLEGRSAIYSDRPQIPVISDTELLDWSYNTGSAPYGERWRKQRRMTHDVLKNFTDHEHFELMETETRLMLRRLLGGSCNIEKEVRRAVSAQIISAVYGYKVTSSDDYFVRGFQTAVEHFCQAAIPANFAVNFIPWLKYIPEWVPGTGWKNKVREWRHQRDTMVEEPYEWAKSQISAGTALPSMVKTGLASINSNPNVNPAESESYLKWAAATLFGGGSDSTVSTVLSFIVAMLRHPESQARAQREIDEVIGKERLPEVSDIYSMPYMRRVVHEVLRWQPALPLGFPHAVAKDDIYKGYFIPKGSIVIANIWAMDRDKSIYVEPDSFDPDRFLDVTVPNPPAFGFGRRLCPGNEFAEKSLFIIFASLLAVFNLKPPIDPVTSNLLIPEAKVTTHALVSHPLPFDCVFEPRSDAHAKLLEDL